MITERALRGALERLKLIRFFPATSAECLAELADMCCETFDRDDDLQRAIAAILREPDWAEWRGAGTFFASLQATRKIQTSKRDVVCSRCSGCGRVVAARFVGSPVLSIVGLPDNDLYEQCPDCTAKQNHTLERAAS